MFCYVAGSNTKTKTKPGTVGKYLTDFCLSRAELQLFACVGREEQEDISEHAGSGGANRSGQLPFWQEKQSQQPTERKWQLDQEMEGRREKTEDEWETGL